MYSTQEWTQIQEADQAERLYLRVYTRGWLSRIGTRLRGRSGDLQSLASAAQGWIVRSQRSGGRETVSLDQIQGSEGRSADFDADFRPRSMHSRSRWVGLARAWMSGVTLPPVELIRVGEVYFVRDGHHRISVARAFGHRAIEVDVSVWDVGAQTAPAMSPRPYAAPDCSPATSQAVLALCD